MSTTTEPATTVHTDEDYRGHRIYHATREVPISGPRGVYVDRIASVDGRRFRCPEGDIATVARKLRAYADREIADAEILPRLVPLVRNAGADDEVFRPAMVELGSVVYVHAMGHLRRGLVTKIGRTRVEVAYTTASSNGRVFRKAVAVERLRVVR